MGEWGGALGMNRTVGAPRLAWSLGFHMMIGGSVKRLNLFLIYSYFDIYTV